MIAGALLLAAVTGSGVIPVPASVSRFPDPSFWPGRGTQQVATMLAAVRTEAGGQMRTSGPGPHQLMARWRAGSLDADERVAVLLGGATFHNPVLLPAYVEGLRSAALRERQAAAVGLAWLMGENPPDPRLIARDPDASRKLASFAKFLAASCRKHSLVAIWMNSYLASVGLPRSYRLVLVRRPEACLAAIASIAEPSDLDELVALWPLLRTREQRYAVLRIFEMVTLIPFVPPPPAGSRETSSSWLLEAGARRVDGFVGRSCTSRDGEALFRRVAARAAGVSASDLDDAGPWLAVLRHRPPSFWAVPLERLTAFGAPAVDFDRTNPDASSNIGAADMVREYFPVTR